MATGGGIPSAQLVELRSHLIKNVAIQCFSFAAKHAIPFAGYQDNGGDLVDAPQPDVFMDTEENGEPSSGTDWSATSLSALGKGNGRKRTWSVMANITVVGNRY